jgi:hypothetical protein
MYFAKLDARLSLSCIDRIVMIFRRLRYENTFHMNGQILRTVATFKTKIISFLVQIDG